MQIVELNRGADDLEQARHDGDPHADRLQRAHQIEDLVGLGSAPSRRDDRALDVHRFGQLVDLVQPGRGEGVDRPGRGLVEIDLRDDLRLDTAVAAQLGADRLGEAFVADEQASLERRQAEGDRAGARAGENQQRC